MGDEKNQVNSQPDKNLAAEQRPTPSQAEGDLETVEQDIQEKDKQDLNKKRAASKSSSS